MIVQIFRIQMGSHQHLIVLTPHPFCCFYADLMRLLRRDLPDIKALVAVVGNVLPTFPEVTFDGNHCLSRLYTPDCYTRNS